MAGRKDGPGRTVEENDQGEEEISASIGCGDAFESAMQSGAR
jgi:hypothetical protein